MSIESSELKDFPLIAENDYWQKILSSVANEGNLLRIDFDIQGKRISRSQSSHHGVDIYIDRLDESFYRHTNACEFQTHASLPGFLYLLTLRQGQDNVGWTMWLSPLTDQSHFLYETLAVGILELNCDWEAIYVNNYLCSMLGMTREELDGLGWIGIFTELEFVKIRQHIELNNDILTPYLFDFTFRTPLGRSIVLQLHVSSHHSINPALNRYELVFIDSTEKYQLEQKLIQAARQDSLTGLLNHKTFRNLLEDSLPAEIAGGAMIFFDVDKFKDINDTYGHAFGDVVIKRVAKMLTRLFPYDAQVARFGGDEFVIFLAKVTNDEAKRKLHEKLMNNLQLQIEQCGIEIMVDMSVGVAFGSEQSETTSAKMVEELLDNADMAMYRAKRLGREPHLCSYDSKIRHELELTKNKENEALKLLEREHVAVVFQPIIKSEKIVSIEALIRLKIMQYHQNVGELLDTVAKHPLRQEILLALIEYQLEDYAMLCNDLPLEISAPILNINVVPDELENTQVVKVIADKIISHNIPFRYITFEVTETSIEKETTRFIDALKMIDKLGIRLSIDDFGTGYSSLKRLSQSYFAQLKIDRYFLHDIGNQSDKIVFLKAILLLAKELNIETLAEGVETQEEYEFLTQFGIELYQGFYFCRPCSRDEVRKRLIAQGMKCEQP